MLIWFSGFTLVKRRFSLNFHNRSTFEMEERRTLNTECMCLEKEKYYE